MRVGGKKARALPQSLKRGPARGEAPLDRHQALRAAD